MLAPIVEHVANLEGRVMEQSQVFNDMHRTLDDLRRTVREMDAKISRRLMWPVGLQITTVLAIIALLRR